MSGQRWPPSVSLAPATVAAEPQPAIPFVPAAVRHSATAAIALAPAWTTEPARRLSSCPSNTRQIRFRPVSIRITVYMVTVLVKAIEGRLREAD